MSTPVRKDSRRGVDEAHLLALSVPGPEQIGVQVTIKFIGRLETELTVFEKMKVSGAFEIKTSLLGSAAGHLDQATEDVGKDLFDLALGGVGTPCEVTKGNLQEIFLDSRLNNGLN